MTILISKGQNYIGDQKLFRLAENTVEEDQAP